MKAPQHLYIPLNAPLGGPPPLDGDPGLDNPNVEGFRWRTSWFIVNPTTGAEDYSTIDNALALCVSKGKKFGLSVSMGTGTPDWVYDDSPTVERFALDPVNEVGDMPIPWDVNYLPKLLAHIARLGFLYNGHPSVTYVVVSGFMQHFEAYLAKTDDEESRLTTSAIDAGFTSLADAYETTSHTIIDAYVTAFPDTSVLFTSARPWPSDPGAIGTEQGALRDWIVGTYPERAGWMTAQLHAKPAPWVEGTPVNWPHGYQAVSAGGNLEKFYIDVPVPPPVAPQMMIDFIHAGLQLPFQAQFLEIYAVDMNQEINQATFSELGPLLVNFLDTTEPPPVEPPPVIVPPGEIGRLPVPRIIPCRTGTHARTVIMARKRLGPPVILPVAPGPVENLFVTTPGEPSSGQAVATFRSPKGSNPAKLSYTIYLVGGSGTITIISQVPI